MLQCIRDHGMSRDLVAAGFWKERSGRKKKERSIVGTRLWVGFFAWSTGIKISDDHRAEKPTMKPFLFPRGLISAP